MKFKYIGPNRIEKLYDADGYSGKKEFPANVYGGGQVFNGETIELDGFLAEKAMKNPNYELVKPGPKPKAKPGPKPKLKVDEPAEVIQEPNITE